METVEKKGQSRRQKRKSRGIKGKKSSHFRTVHVGGFEEGQVLCYLWDIVKVLEMGWGEAGLESGEETGAEAVQRLEKQLRRRVRVEIRRYFTRHKRRNMRLSAGILCAVLCVVWLFGYQIGVDRVSGNSMYPYLNDGDWIVYSRRGRGIRRDDVIVFEKNGEIMVKRVAGLPGDRVEMNRSGSRVVINGVEELKENAETEDKDLSGSIKTVMDGQYLVLGDNREESVDSRDSKVGTVPSEAITGRVLWIIRQRR